MAAYFDSSAVLAFMLREKEGRETAKVWAETSVRVSSLLLRAECLINLRRNADAAAKAPRGWLADQADAMGKLMFELTLKDFDAPILAIMEREEKLADCRTLDAIHLATALFFKEKTDEDFFLVSLDERMRRTAAKLKLKALPA